MTAIPYSSALIVGTGIGISASVARQLSAAGLQVAVAARNIAKLDPLVSGTGIKAFSVDATDPASVVSLFDQVDSAIGEPDVVMYNASARLPGAIVDLDPEAVRKVMEVAAFGGFLVTQQAAKRLVPKRRGAIFLTGATASVKGFANHAAFALGKFGLRGLAQSAARELSPQGIHVAHFVVDGVVRTTRADRPGEPDSSLDPDAIAQSYLDVLRQPRSAWSWELELRPWLETY